MSGGSRWFCTTPEDQWPFADMEGAIAAIKQDFDGQWGDSKRLSRFVDASEADRPVLAFASSRTTRTSVNMHDLCISPTN